MIRICQPRFWERFIARFSKVDCSKELVVGVGEIFVKPRLVFLLWRHDAGTTPGGVMENFAVGNGTTCVTASNTSPLFFFCCCFFCVCCWVWRAYDTGQQTVYWQLNLSAARADVFFYDERPYCGCYVFDSCWVGVVTQRLQSWYGHALDFGCCSHGSSSFIDNTEYRALSSTRFLEHALYLKDRV